MYLLIWFIVSRLVYILNITYSEDRKIEIVNKHAELSEDAWHLSPAVGDCMLIVFGPAIVAQLISTALLNWNKANKQKYKTENKMLKQRLVDIETQMNNLGVEVGRISETYTDPARLAAIREVHQLTLRK